MTICTNCKGTGIIENNRLLNNACKCWHCQGAGFILLREYHRRDHHFHLYKDDHEQIETIVSFLSEGLDRREYSICNIEYGKIETLYKALAEAGIDRERDDIKPNLFITTAEDFYFHDQAFEPEKLFGSLVRFVNEALKSHPMGLRGVGGIPAVVHERVNEAEIQLYEALVHDYFERDKPQLLALCQYQANRVSRELLSSLILAHDVTISA